MNTGPFLIAHSIGYVAGVTDSGVVITSPFEFAQIFPTLLEAQHFLRAADSGLDGKPTILPLSQFDAVAMPLQAAA